MIESINRKKGRAKVRFYELLYLCSNSCSRSQVRFIGFNNKEEKEVDELFLSKGEERRKEQESRGEGGIRFSSSGTYMSDMHLYPFNGRWRYMLKCMHHKHLYLQGG